MTVHEICKVSGMPGKPQSPPEHKNFREARAYNIACLGSANQAACTTVKINFLNCDKNKELLAVEQQD
jgi:hypothetical protein